MTELKSIGQSLAKSANRENGLIKRVGLLLPEGWDQVAQTGYSAYRTKATNPELGLFAKIFSSDAELYATTVYETCLDLATIQLNVPILKPIGVEHGVLFFPLGISRGEKPVISSVTPEELVKISDIATKYHLESVGKFDRVALIEINQLIHLTDLINDADPLVDRFLGN